MSDDADQDLLRDTARRVLADPRTPPTMTALGGLGWLSLLVDEDAGGAGWRPIEACLIAEEMGRAHEPSPWIGAVLAAGALSRSSNAALRDQWLASLMDGSAVGALCPSGRSVQVIDADRIDVFVTAGHDGLVAFEAAAVANAEPDLSSLDTTRTVWRVERGEEPGVPIGDPAAASELLAVGRLLVSADALGALSGAVERLVAYLTDRHAFGAPIASFQAVQHRLVDLAVLEVRMRSIVGSAARASREHLQSAVRTATIAHAFVSANATGAVDECIQLTGGIGFTWDHPLHHEMRRALLDGSLFGSARASRTRLAEIEQW